jgi:hypothetical protein
MSARDVLRSDEPGQQTADLALVSVSAIVAAGSLPAVEDDEVIEPSLQSRERSR